MESKDSEAISNQTPQPINTIYDLCFVPSPVHLSTPPVRLDIPHPGNTQACWLRLLLGLVNLISRCTAARTQLS